MKKQQTPTDRRNFITTVIGATAAVGLSSVMLPGEAKANMVPAVELKDAEKWLKKQIRGKHKMVFDWTKHNNGAALNWANALMDTYNEMGVSDSDLSIVLVLRYAAAPIALADPIWEKYGFGKKIDLKDPGTGEHTLKNLYAKCDTKDDPCIELFQKRGGLICVCNHSILGSAEGMAAKMNLVKEDVQKEFMDNLLPGIQLVPAGIWALNRSQELGCTFCSAG